MIGAACRYPWRRERNHLAATRRLSADAGEGRIVHSTGREDGIGVIEEPEPEELRARRHRVFRL